MQAKTLSTTKLPRVLKIALAGIVLSLAAKAVYAQAPKRPEGVCDIYAASGAPCVAAHSTTRALYATYNGPLYQVLRQSDGKTLDIGVVQPSALDVGGYADAAAQDRFCANTVCWISILYDQSDKHNDLKQPPRGAFSGPAMGGANNLPIATMAPVTMMGHKVYGVFITPGMGLRLNNTKGVAVDDQAEGIYWVIDGHHYNGGCCFDYGNAETDSRDDQDGTMETTYFGNTPFWFHGPMPGPWVMTDQENNLVGCAPGDKNKQCALPIIKWRFVTAMAKGEPHHWATLGGDAQQGALSVMFDGPRVGTSYDPMRKQGAIVLGNGGDNSNSSQGTFYEGAMTAPGTFPSNATDQKVQANVVAAGYGLPFVTIAPASTPAMPTGVLTFAPGTAKDVTVTFTNSTKAPVSGVKLGVVAPAGWRVSAADGGKASGAIAPGASISTTFHVVAGQRQLNADLIGQAVWNDGGKTRTERAVEKLRNVEPVKINEFRVSDGSQNTTNGFIELYNAGSKPVDLSHWSLTSRPTEQAAFSAISIPANTKLAAKGFYVLGLANSGLAAPAASGDATLHVRSISGMKVGDTVVIGTGANAERRKIVSIGTASGAATTLWQPLPDGPIITIPAGATNVPVTRTAGFVVGQKIGLGYGAIYPDVGLGREKLEIATVTAVGKQGAQAYLGADAHAGDARIQVLAGAPVGLMKLDASSIDTISPGDTIKLDIDSVGHGTETVTVKSVGTQDRMVNIAAANAAGDASITVAGVYGFPVPKPVTFKPGDTIIVGTPASQEKLVVATVTVLQNRLISLRTTTPAQHAHGIGENVVLPGTGLELTAPLTFNHAINTPFSVRGTGISFAPATAHPHSSNEPVLPLGTGITLDAPLAKAHDIDAVVRDESATGVGFQGKPNQWFGGPALSPPAGSMALRNAAGLVVDSLNYGVAVDPWMSKGHQTKSGFGSVGCIIPAPGLPFGFGATTVASNVSAGRYPDGHDGDSSCDDFRVSATTALAADAAIGAQSIQVTSATNIVAGQMIGLGKGSDQETVVVQAVGQGGALTLRTPLKLAHAKQAQVITDMPTPGATNRYAGAAQK